MGNVTTYNDTSVTPGITYYYKVSAINVNGEGPLSNEASATPFSLPFAPVNLVASGIFGYINLTWNVPPSDGNSPIINYMIYRGTSSGSETLYVTIGNITSYDDTNVAVGVTYFYRVSAVNIMGEGPLSNEASATPLAVPSQPLNLIADAGLGYIVLTWDEPASDGGSPVTNYKVYKGLSPGSESFYIQIGNITTYNDSSVLPGITYYYKVSAVNINGEGPQSNGAHATPPNVPYAPLNLTADSGFGYVQLTWEEPESDGGAPITNYRIYRGTTSGSEVFLVMIGNITTYNDTDVLPGVTYYYRVSAVNIAGEGPLSNQASVTTPTIPSPPRSPRISSGDGHVNITWDPPINEIEAKITGYFIYRNSSNELYASVPSDQLWFVDENVSPGINYTYEVTANNDNGEGEPTNEVNIKAGAKPSTPTNVIASGSDSFIIIVWEPPYTDGGYEITNYTVYRGTVDGDEEFLTQIGNVLLFNDTEAENGVTYFYKIVAVNGIGESNLSESTSAISTVNEPPSVMITSPLTLTNIKGKFEILGTSSDPDSSVHRVEIKIDSDNWVQVKGTTSWSYEWDTTSVPNGLHKITARAFDGQKYSPEINATILVDNQEAESDPLEGAWVWVVIVVVALALLYLFWFFRKRQPKDMPDGQIYEIIHQKYFEGEISKETFEDFKKRYKSE
jgi:fibronectin type 3 domain-containing protein